MEEKFVPRHEHEEFAKRIDEEHKRISHRLKQLEEQGKNQTELLLSIKELAMETRDLKREIIDQGERLETLENRDGEKWRKAEWAVIAGLIAAIIGYIAGNIGL